MIYDEGELKNLNAAVAKTAQQTSSFKLQIAGTGIFPAIKNARILWLDVKVKEESLLNLNKLLENECEKYGCAREKRIFKPHLTIARLREPKKLKILVEKHLSSKFEAVEFEVGEIVIYESKLQSSGSIYSIISKHRLSKVSSR